MEHEKLQQSAQSLVEHYLTLANQYFSTSFPMPTLLFKKKGKVAGTAHLKENLIQINLLLAEYHQGAFLAEVIPHELAHLIVFQLYGRVKPHGQEWQAVMQAVFKCPPKRTHQFELPNQSKPKQFNYQCQCQTHQLSTIRHNRVLRQQQQYICRRCKHPLTFFGE